MMRRLATISAVCLAGCTAMLPFERKEPSDAFTDTDGLDITTDPDPDTSIDTTVDSDADPDPDTSIDTTLDPDVDVPPDTGIDTTVDPDADPDPDPDTTLDPDADAPPTIPEFVTISPGTFTMGSPASEPGRIAARETEHEVTLTRSFEIMAYEVTQGQFEALMTYNPSYFPSCGTDCPVERVNWHEAAAYANALSTDAGYAECYTCTGSGTGVDCEPSATYATPYDCPGYRLPTEAEWEYAARAGTTTGTYNGTSTLTGCESPNAVLDPIAWFCGNSSDTTHEVGTRDVNPWGLYDMLGNVWEWCHDWYVEGLGTGAVTDPWGPVTGSNRVLRGGSWGNDAGSARAAGRRDGDPGSRNGFFGFRLARSLP